MGVVDPLFDSESLSNLNCSYSPFNVKPGIKVQGPKYGIRYRSNAVIWPEFAIFKIERNLLEMLQ